MSRTSSQPSLSPISLVDQKQDEKKGGKKMKDVNFNFQSLNINSSLESDKLNQSSETGETLNQSTSTAIDKTLAVNVKKPRDISPISDGDISRSSPAYSEQWEEYSSPRKTAMSSQMGQFTHRSRESGRLSPVLDETSIDMRDQPSQQHRFNEPLKIRKGRNFVDFKPPSPTVVHVPNRSFAHGRWTNVTVQRKNGRYVVIEQRPVYTQFTDSSTVKRGYQKDLFGPDKSWTKKKAPWSWSTKGSYIGRSVNRGFQEPYLPPMKERYSHVASRVGSMDYADHVPGGGTHKVPSFKLKWEAEAKIGSLPPPTSRSEGVPGLKLPSISPRYGASADSESFTTIHYTPGGNVVLRKQRYLDAKSQVGSLDNVSYSPGGGDISIPQKSIKWKKESKIGSLDNITHLPKSSNVQIFSDKLKWKTEPKVGSLDNAHHIPRTKKFKVPNFKREWGKAAASRIDSLSNVEHTPRGGNVQIIDVPKKWKGKSKIDSKWKFNYDYKSLFGDDHDEVDRQTFSNASSFPYTV